MTVRVQVQVLNFTLHPYLYLITRTRDLRAETWDPKIFSRLHLCTSRRRVALLHLLLKQSLPDKYRGYE